MSSQVQPMTTPIPAKAGRREWIGLAVLALPALLVSIDIFVLLMALPELSAKLHVSSTQQLWITDMYGFTLSGFMVTMGTLGDRIGRRKVLLVGAAAFGLTSIMAAFSTSGAMLIVARALMGIAGAALGPSLLSLINHMFRDPKERALSFGIWLACFSVGSIIGPVVGGILLEHFWWGSVFLIGVPAMVLLLILGPVLLPEYRNPRAERLDLPSVVLYLAGILPTIYGIKELAASSGRVVPVLSIAAGLAFAAAFVRRQRQLKDPLLDLNLFKNRDFSTMLCSMLLYTMFSGTAMLYITQHLQLVEGLSTLQAGLALVPGLASALVSFQLSPLLARRVRPANLIAAGLLISATGLLLLTQAGNTAGYAALVLSFVVMNLGSGPLITLGTNLVVGSVPPEKAGAAGAIAQTSNEFGFALGIATLGSAGTAIYRHQLASHLPAGLPAAAATTARQTLAGATAVSQHLPHQLATALLSPARAAFTTSLHVVAAIAAGIVVIVTVLIVATLRRLRPLGQPDPSVEPTNAV